MYKGKEMKTNQEVREERAVTPHDLEDSGLQQISLSLNLETILHHASPAGYEGAEHILLAPNEVLPREVERQTIPYFTESSPGNGYTYLTPEARAIVLTQNPMRQVDLERMGAIPKGVSVHVIPTLQSSEADYHDVISQMIEETASVRSKGLATKQTRRLQKDAYTDQLTGIPNRRQYDQDRKKHLGFAAREGNEVYIGFADVEAFTLFNGIYGHATGDRVLNKFANALNFTISKRIEDKCYRFGGDEFVPVVHTNASGIATIQKKAIDAVKSITIPNPHYLENPHAQDDNGRPLWQNGDEVLSVKMHLAFVKVDTQLFAKHVPVEKMRSLDDSFYNEWFETARYEAEKEAKKNSWRGKEREYLALPSSATHRRSLHYKNMTSQDIGREILEGKYVI